MKKISLNKKDNKVIAITLASWGIIMIATSLFIGGGKEPIIKTSYSVAINEGQVMQFKTNEIKLKDIELEINTPLSVDIKDYLEDYKSIDDAILNSLKKRELNLKLTINQLKNINKEPEEKMSNSITNIFINNTTPKFLYKKICIDFYAIIFNNLFVSYLSFKLKALINSFFIQIEKFINKKN